MHEIQGDCTYENCRIRYDKMYQNSHLSICPQQSLLKNCCQWVGFNLTINLKPAKIGENNTNFHITGFIYRASNQNGWEEEKKNAKTVSRKYPSSEIDKMYDCGSNTYPKPSSLETCLKAFSNPKKSFF